MQPVKGIWKCGVMVMGEKKTNNLVLATGYMQATYIVYHCSRKNSLSASQKGYSIKQLQNCFTVNSVGENISS